MQDGAGRERREHALKTGLLIAKMCVAGTLGGVAFAWAAWAPGLSLGAYMAYSMIGFAAGLALGISFAAIFHSREVVSGRSVEATERSSGDSLSDAAGSFSVIRENVARLLGGDDALSGKILCVTSVAAGEGKTTTLLGLAASFAASGRRCIAIDLCRKNPCLHDHLEVSRCPGIAEYLHGDAAAADVTKETSYPGLSVIPAGDGPWKASASDIVSRVASLLKEIEPDGMALLDVDDLALARDIVGTIDLVIMVERIGFTNKDEFATACALLSEHGPGKVVIVANDVAVTSKSLAASRLSKWELN
jgi:receptor protein-tyrosine kinase